MYQIKLIEARLRLAVLYCGKRTNTDGVLQALIESLTAVLYCVTNDTDTLIETNTT